MRNITRHALRFIPSLLTPVLAHAQINPSAVSGNITIARIFQRLSQVFNRIIPFLVLLATVVFIWGVVKYITAGADEKKVEEAKNIILWGIIALAVMLMVWGFVNVLIDAIFGTENIPNIPGPDITPFL